VTASSANWSTVDARACCSVASPRNRIDPRSGGRATRIKWGSGLVGFRRSFYGSTFVTGREGLEIVAGDSPEIVLVDFGLPDMDGYEVARQLHHKLGFRVGLAAVTEFGQPEIGKDLRRRASMVIWSRLSRSRMLRGFSWPSDARRVGSCPRECLHITLGFRGKRARPLSGRDCFIA
jgi:CheY-like chemotaxis protein